MSAWSESEFCLPINSSRIKGKSLLASLKCHPMPPLPWVRCRHKTEKTTTIAEMHAITSVSSPIIATLNSCMILCTESISYCNSLNTLTKDKSPSNDPSISTRKSPPILDTEDLVILGKSFYYCQGVSTAVLKSLLHSQTCITQNTGVF